MATLTLNAHNRPVLDALAAAWASIQAHHADVPDVVLVLGSGTATKTAKHGHFAPGRWTQQQLTKPEVLIAGESLKHGAEQVLTTLLHEAVHAQHHAAGVQDTSRGGRYHNRRFRDTAVAFGLRTEGDRLHGCLTPGVTDATKTRYAKDLRRLDRAIAGAYRTREPRLGREPAGSNYLLLTCGCGRRIRAAASTIAAGGITCQLCGDDFKTPADVSAA